MIVNNFCPANSYLRERIYRIQRPQEWKKKYWLFISWQKFVICTLWDGEPWVVPSACSQQETRGRYRKAELSLTPVGTSALHSIVHTKVLNVVQESGVKHHRQFPKWLLKATECYGATSAFGNTAWLSFLHRSHCSSSSNTALPHIVPSVPRSGLVPKPWDRTQSVWKQRNKSLGCPVTSVPVTAAELPNCSSQPKQPLSPSKTHPVAVWWKGQRASSSLKSTKWKGNLCF